MYKLICFDLDDTLWPCLPTIQRAEQTLYNWLSEHKPDITQNYTIDQLREQRKKLIQAQPDLAHDLSAARRQHLLQLASELGEQGDWVEVAFQVYYMARQGVELYDDVIPVLSALKSRYQLAALTNGNAHIRHTGLDDFFAFQISAADVIAGKPDPAMFNQAMKKAGVKPPQTLHVGDHPLHDIQGARNAGVDAVWIKRFGQSWDLDTPENEQQFTDLYQLRDWLSELERA